MRTTAPGIRARVCSTPELGEAERLALRALLDAAFEGDFSDDDWAHALGGVHALLSEAGDGRLLAHASLVPRTLFVGARRIDAGYLEAVATRPDAQGRGLGTHVVQLLEAALANHPLCALSTSAHGFYERLGWVRWQGPTWVLGADGVRRRSAEEDVGIMVRPASSWDLAADLCCEDRTGDAW